MCVISFNGLSFLGVDYWGYLYWNGIEVKIESCLNWYECVFVIFVILGMVFVVVFDVI